MKDTKQQEMILRLQNWIKESHSVVFFGGAGVSTESGIPDFRSVDGLYHETYQFPPETILSRTFFHQNTVEFYRFYRNKMLYPHAKPNEAHLALAHMEASGKLRSVITQNIDGLHQAAGSRRVWELHGSVHRNYCMKCHSYYPMETILNSEGIPTCHCGGTIKPDVVLYEESLAPSVLEGAIADLKQADLLIIGGTSLAVYPAAGLIDYFTGKHLVLINKTSTPYDRSADLVIQAAIGAVFRAMSSQ